MISCNSDPHTWPANLLPILNFLFLGGFSLTVTSTLGKKLAGRKVAVVLEISVHGLIAVLWSRDKEDHGDKNDRAQWYTLNGEQEAGRYRWENLKTSIPFQGTLSVALLTSQHSETPGDLGLNDSVGVI